MIPFELKQALEQGYAYTRDKKKIVDLKLSDYNVTYRLTGRIENNPESVKAWTVNGVSLLGNEPNPLDLCYLEIWASANIQIEIDEFVSRWDALIDVEKLQDVLSNQCFKLKDYDKVVITVNL
jgi:hypothetical protein